MEKLFNDRRLYTFLEQVDKDFAAEAQSGGCDHCGAALHRGDYGRKPRGGPSWDKRYSFCCSRDGCRKRKTPPSVRFLGRKVYVGIVVVLVSAMMHGPSNRRLEYLQRELPIDRRTLKRWREWWTEIFVHLAFWKAERGRFARYMAGEQMPLDLVEAFDAQHIEGLVKLMKFLSPITTRTCLAGGFT
ncbi:MAG: hypothetical protein KJ621_14775 [Proteobacteria bacterium]|nr:hypothetical protein [Pseudomonadota bacterium]